MALTQESKATAWRAAGLIYGLAVLFFVWGGLQTGVRGWPLVAQGLLSGIWVLLALVFSGGLLWLYFLPAVLAHRRAHQHEPAILLLNLFFGLTVIGWFIALIWASTAPVTLTAPDQRQSASGAFCSRCGAANLVGAAFCARCGSPTA